MEPSSTGFYLIIGGLDFGPAEGNEIEHPQVVHVGNALTSKNHKVRVN